jgi:putative lipoic acid-binding regulatory protein
MTAHRWALDPALADRVASLASDLSAAAAEHQTEWDDKSEKWQESDKGSEVSTWIEALADTADQLEALETKA